MPLAPGGPSDQSETESFLCNSLLDSRFPAFLNGKTPWVLHVLMKRQLNATMKRSTEATATGTHLPLLCAFLFKNGRRRGSGVCAGPTNPPHASRTAVAVFVCGPIFARSFTAAGVAGWPPRLTFFVEKPWRMSVSLEKATSTEKPSNF